MRPDPAEIQAVAMTCQEAQQTTERIRAHFEENRRLIKEMYDRRGWEAPGYDSFPDWARKAVGQSYGAVHQQLQGARIDEVINDPGSTMVDPGLLIGSIPERVLRPLALHLDEPEKVREAWDRAREGASGSSSTSTWSPRSSWHRGSRQARPGRRARARTRAADPAAYTPRGRVAGAGRGK